MPGTCTVACKLPHGLTLRLFDMVDVDVPVVGGGVKTVKEARARTDKPVVYIKGNAHPMERAPEQQIVGGYALTHGVDADFFHEWVKQNSGPNGLDALNAIPPLIFAHEKPGMAEGRAREQKAVRSGQERIDPENLPLRRVATATSRIE